MKRLLIGLTIAGSVFASSVDAATHTVKLLTTGTNSQMMVMEPAYLAVEVGDSVVFTPSDSTHNVESFAIPAGATPFNSAMGQPVTITFDKEGAYFYKCTPHFMLGMIGMIQAGSAVNKSEVTASWKALEAQVVMNKERGQALLSSLK